MNIKWILALCSYSILATSKTNDLSSDKIDYGIEKLTPAISEMTRGEVKTEVIISRKKNLWMSPNPNYETSRNGIGRPWNLLEDGFQLSNNKTCPQKNFKITSNCYYKAGAVKMSETIDCVDEKKCEITAFHNVSYRFELSGLTETIARKLVKFLRSDPITKPLMYKYRAYPEERYLDDVKVALLWFNAFYWQVTGSYTFCSENGRVETVEGVKIRFPIYTRDRMMEGLFGILDICQKGALDTTRLISFVDYLKARTLYDFYCVKAKTYNQ